MNTETKTKGTGNILLQKVPDDVKDMIDNYKTKKKEECGCRFGNSQAVYNMLRKYRILQSANLPDATAGKS
jgi:hypothetical protein